MDLVKQLKRIPSSWFNGIHIYSSFNPNSPISDFIVPDACLYLPIYSINHQDPAIEPHSTELEMSGIERLKIALAAANFSFSCFLLT